MKLDLCLFISWVTCSNTKLYSIFYCTQNTISILIEPSLVFKYISNSLSKDLFKVSCSCLLVSIAYLSLYKVYLYRGLEFSAGNAGCLFQEALDLN